MNLLRRILSIFRPRRVLLTVMHLDDMHRVHPDQIEARCSACGGRPVGVYPSGQRVMRKHRVTLVCNRCHTPGPDARLAPGAIGEAFESRDK